MTDLTNGLSGIYIYATKEDAVLTIQEEYPLSKESTDRIDDEDMLLVHETEAGLADRQFQVWEYTHPGRDSIWVVNVIKVSYEP